MELLKKSTKKKISEAYGISSQTLRNYMNSEPLKSLLLQAGYKKNKQHITPLQQRIIFEHLDSPF